MFSCLLSIVLCDIFYKISQEVWGGALLLLTECEEVDMDKKELKKLLASLSIASLIAGAGLSVTGCATAWSGEKAGAGSTDVESSTTKEAPAKKPAGGSGWS